MAYRLRHQGSPKAIGPLTLKQIVQGLQDGQFDDTDEVMGAGERNWTSIEQHHDFEPILEEMEPLPVHIEEDNNLDMNPLIDVCLVLLVFFILTSGYKSLEKVLDVPRLKAEKKDEQKSQVRKVAARDVDRTMIRVTAEQRELAEVIRVDGKEVPEAELTQAFRRIMNDSPSKNQLLVEAKEVKWGTVVRIIDSAAGAKIEKVNFQK